MPNEKKARKPAARQLAPADLLKSICNILFKHSVRAEPERTKADPHAYRKVQEKVVADIGKAEQMIRAALGPADPLSRQAGTILDRLRSRFIPIIEGVKRTRLHGRELHDEHPENRPSFALAVAELHDELISFSKQVRRAMTPAPHAPPVQSAGAPAEQVLPPIPVETASKILGKNRSTVYRTLPVEGGEVDPAAFIAALIEKNKTTTDEAMEERGREAAKTRESKTATKADVSGGTWSCTGAGCPWTGEFQEDEKCPACRSEIGIIPPRKRR